MLGTTGNVKELEGTGGNLDQSSRVQCVVDWFGPTNMTTMGRQGDKPGTPVAKLIEDYPIGHLIGFQIEEQMKKTGRLGPEFERMTRFGNVTPDLWMKNATGAPVGAEAMLSAAKRALAEGRR